MNRIAGAHKALTVFFWLFYTATVILWFKGSFPKLRPIPISCVIPFVGLIVIILIRTFRCFTIKKPAIRIRFNRGILILILLIIAVVAVRIPYLINNAGLSHSDDGLTMLMSKHIAEGKLPPLYFYKQYYQGSLFSHFNALVIILFGYSQLLMEAAVLFFYLLFVAVQFYFLKMLFSLNFAATASAFYCLPIPNLIKCSFFFSSAYPLVLFLGTTILLLSYLVVYREKTQLLPGLGFLMGLAFWTHQISIVFILTAMVMLAPKIRTLWRKYLSSVFYVLMGCLPVLIAEILWNFPLVKYLAFSEKNTLGGVNIQKSFEMFLLTFSQSPNVLSYAFFLLLLLGLITLLYSSFKSKKLNPQALYSIFFLIFACVYFMSRFSQRNVIRYFYFLYFSMPVLFLGFFWVIRSKFKYYLMSLVFLVMFFGLNLRGIQKNLQEVKTAHRQRTQTVSAMKKTGKRYWRANFWAAYLLSALSREELIVDSYSVNRYFPYRLMYENEGTTENFVFITDGMRSEQRLALRFTKLLEACHLDYKNENLGGYWLVYNIQTPVSPKVLMAPVHSGFPDLEISRTNFKSGFINMNFSNIGSREGSGYWIHVQIPGFSSAVKGFPAAKGQVDVRLPYPQTQSFPLEFHLNYKGIKIAQSQKRTTGHPPAQNQARKKKIVFLSGIGPKVKIENREMLTCAREVDIELNGKLVNFSRIRIDLFSQFNFNDPAWYGEFFQEVGVLFNGIPIKKMILQDGHNVISIPFEGLSFNKNVNMLSLRFKHHLFFNFSPSGKIAALLEKIKLER